MASFYFANRRSRTFREGFESIRETRSRFVDAPASDVRIEEFYSRPVMSNGATSQVEYTDYTYTKVAPPSPEQENPVGSLLIERKIPVKVEPKALLANERTFLAWMHSSLWLFGASITVLNYSHGDPTKIVYGSMIMPVALAFIFYSIFQFMRRAEMLKRKAPGPFHDTVGPTLFAMSLMIAIIAQFCIQLQLYRQTTK